LKTQKKIDAIRKCKCNAKKSEQEIGKASQKEKGKQLNKGSEKNKNESRFW
jgi:hypothetical protein